ncbi:MAG: homoserine dehydrogenase [Thermaerobacter sp.]|nr:homoserine dehydrogenase [Thermaerobacter sp.]
MPKLALIGFGGVGQAFAEIVGERQEEIARRFGLDLTIVAVADPVKGSLFRDEGLEPAVLVAAAQGAALLAGYPEQPGLVRGLDSLTTIRESSADVILELSPTLADGQPAIEHCEAAFAHGLHVITSNKGPVVLRYRELFAKAQEAGVEFGIEGTVMSGTPSLDLGRAALAGNRILAVRGILNGTTNYILTRMEEGLEYEDALREAQGLGYAEADPAGDVEGFDALYKVVILAAHVLGEQVAPQDVAREGISQLTRAEVAAAAREGRHWKLIAQLERTEAGLRASVGPVLLPADDPLGSVRGATNAITYTCDLLGPVTLIGAGAGRRETAFALLHDLIRIGRSTTSVGRRPA